MREFAPGSQLILEPGESVCLTQGVYHRFWGETGSGPVLVGEVSMVNDDRTDNHWLEEIGRFPSIEEDEAPLHLIAADYCRWIRKF